MDNKEHSDSDSDSDSAGAIPSTPTNRSLGGFLGL